MGSRERYPTHHDSQFSADVSIEADISIEPLLELFFRPLCDD